MKYKPSTYVIGYMVITLFTGIWSGINHRNPIPSLVVCGFLYVIWILTIILSVLTKEK